jgi:hypothetical protein
LYDQHRLLTRSLQLYEEDAIVGHREFDLKLTQRVKMSMVGVPEMSFNFWAACVFFLLFDYFLVVADVRPRKFLGKGQGWCGYLRPTR